MNPIRVGLEVMSGDQRCKNMAGEPVGRTAVLARPPYHGNCYQACFNDSKG